MSDALSLLFLLGLVLAGGAPLLVAARRQRLLRRAATRADIARLAQYLPRAGRAPAPVPALLAHLAQADLAELYRIGDSALASEHPCAPALFDAVYAVVAARERQRRREARRRANWDALRSGEASSDVPADA